MALSVADNCVLLGEGLIWLTDHLDLQVTSHSTAMCRLTYFLRYGGRLCSALLTTIITAERYFFISHPLKSARFLTTTGARIVVIAVPALSFSLTSYTLYTLEVVKVAPENHYCHIGHLYEAQFIVWDLAVSRLLCDVITGCVVATFTTMILRTLVVARRQREQLLPDIVPTGRQMLEARELQLTLILVMVAVAFIVLKLPYTVSWYAKHFLKEHTAAGYDLTPINNIVSVTYIFAVGCYATNLFLYSLGGSLFRAKLQGHFRGMFRPVSLLGARRQRAHHPNAQQGIRDTPL